MKKLSKHIVTLLSILWVLVLIWNCDAVDPDEAMRLEDPGAVRIIYNGLSQEGDASLASFTIVNDSTESIQYFAYDSHSMHYSTETLTDTGWVYLSWNWCGTGASYFTLEPEDKVDFYTSLPNTSCTWRVVLSIADLELSTSYLLWSESLLYIAP